MLCEGLAMIVKRAGGQLKRRGGGRRKGGRRGQEGPPLPRRERKESVPPPLHFDQREERARVPPLHTSLFTFMLPAKHKDSAPAVSKQRGRFSACGPEAARPRGAAGGRSAKGSREGGLKFGSVLAPGSPAAGGQDGAREPRAADAAVERSGITSSFLAPWRRAAGPGEGPGGPA